MNIVGIKIDNLERGFNPRRFQSPILGLKPSYGGVLGCILLLFLFDDVKNDPI